MALLSPRYWGETPRQRFVQGTGTLGGPIRQQVSDLSGLEPLLPVADLYCRAGNTLSESEEPDNDDWWTIASIFSHESIAQEVLRLCQDLHNSLNDKYGLAKALTYKTPHPLTHGYLEGGVTIDVSRGDIDLAFSKAAHTLAGSWTLFCPLFWTVLRGNPGREANLVGKKAKGTNDAVRRLRLSRRLEQGDTLLNWTSIDLVKPYRQDGRKWANISVGGIKSLAPKLVNFTGTKPFDSFRKVSDCVDRMIETVVFAEFAKSKFCRDNYPIHQFVAVMKRMPIVGGHLASDQPKSLSRDRHWRGTPRSGPIFFLMTGGEFLAQAASKLGVKYRKRKSVDSYILEPVTSRSVWTRAIWTELNIRDPGVNEISYYSRWGSRFAVVGPHVVPQVIATTHEMLNLIEERFSAQELRKIKPDLRSGRAVRSYLIDKLLETGLSIPIYTYSSLKAVEGKKNKVKTPWNYPFLAREVQVRGDALALAKNQFWRPEHDFES
jgi:hypothetical protein